MNNRIWILLLIVAACAVPVFGQVQQQIEVPPDDGGSGGGGGWYFSSSYEQGQYMDNPCTAVQDWVWVNYSAYVESAQKEAGLNRYLVNDSTSVGGMYAASGTAQADVGYSAPFSIRNYYKVNTGDDFHVVTVATLDPSSQYTSVTVETACGNGLPDSKE
jgi:hypothetical protein